MTRAIVVTAAVIERDGLVLVTQRPAGSHLEGQWEFPGGKCDPGESLAACMARELHEELGVDATVEDEVFTTTHDYGDRTVELHFLRCEIAGEPQPQQGQALQWIPRHRLTELTFPAADAALIRWLVLEGPAQATDRRTERE